MQRLVLSLILVFLCATLAQAQPVTWTQLAFPDPGAPTRPVGIKGVTNLLTFLGDTRVGSFFVRAGVLSLIDCPNVTPPPTDLRRGPSIKGLNNQEWAVGDIMDSATNQRVSVLQDVPGSNCTIVRAPGANVVSTLLYTVDDAGNSAGYFSTDNFAAGLRRHQGFERYADGTFHNLNGLCPNEVLYPDSRREDVMVGHADCDIQPGNASLYKGWYWKPTTGFQELQGPDGRPLWIPTVNNLGIAYGSTVSGQAGVTGGAAWKIDLNTTPPTITPFPLPPATRGGTVRTCNPVASNDTGGVVCIASEDLPDCPDPAIPNAQECNVTTQWLAQFAEEPPPPTRQPKAKKPKKEEPKKEERRPQPR